VVESSRSFTWHSSWLHKFAATYLNDMVSPEVLAVLQHTDLFVGVSSWTEHGK
jgi:hypothetical protein